MLKQVVGERTGAPVFLRRRIADGACEPVLGGMTDAELEQELWGDEHPQSDSLRSHMHLLRRALTDASGLSPIETVHGVGYSFSAADVGQT